MSDAAPSGPLVAAPAPPRRKLRWVHLVATSVLLGGVLVLVNLLAARHPHRLDLTRERRFSLGDETLRRLALLDRDVEIYLMPVYLPQEGTPDPRIPRVQERVRNILNEYAAHSPLVKVRWVTERDAEVFGLLQKVFEQVSGQDMIYVLSTAPGGAVKKQQLSFYQLYDAGMYGGNVINFVAEELLTNAIVNVTRDESRVVYATTLHKEASVDNATDPYGMWVLTTEFKNRDGVTLKPLELGTTGGVPSDCSLLLIVGPQEPFSEPEILHVRDYLERGGNLFYAPSLDAKTGMEPLLRSWGVEIGPYLVLDPWGVRVRCGQFAPHEINRGMVNTVYEMPRTVGIEPVERKEARIASLPLFQSGPQSWEERQPLEARIPRRWEPPERKGPLSLAVAVEAEVDKPIDPAKNRARIVVWGSSLALSNDFLFDRRSGPVPQNVGYLLNAFRWLLGKPETIAIPPVRDETKPFKPDESAQKLLWWTIQVVFPLLAAILGLVVWFVRRV